MNDEVIALSPRRRGNLPGLLRISRLWRHLASAVLEDGDCLGSRECIGDPHPRPVVEDVRGLLAEGGPVNLVEDADVAERLAERLEVPRVGRQILDSHSHVVPPGGVSAMGVLHPWKDVEEDSLDTNNTNPKCQGALVGVVEDDEEIL